MHKVLCLDNKERMLLLEGHASHLRTLFNPLLERVPNNTFQCSSLCFLYELIIYTFMHQSARTSTTTLTLQMESNAMTSLAKF